MFGWFKKPKPIPEGFKAFADKVIAPVAMARALLDVATQHASAIQAGQADFPVHKAKGVSVAKVWHHLRLEACIGCIGFGDGSLVDLAMTGKQDAVLSEFLDNRAHLQFPQPSGSEIAQSIQAMWQAYVYLGEVGSSVCDRQTDRFILKSEGRDILSRLEAEAWALRNKRSAYFAKQSDELPPTLFDAFFADLNRKTKSIALSRFLGPEGTDAIPLVIEEARGAVGDEGAEQLRKTLQLIVSASNPDEAIAQLEQAQ